MNILVLSKIYPADDLSPSETPVVHYFAREWVKMGHTVKVFVNYPTFPKILYGIIKPFENLISSYVGGPLPSFCLQRHYMQDGVDIYRLPLKKILPHGCFSNRTLQEQVDKIRLILDKINFIPDIIVGHWWNPQLFLLKSLKEIYKTKTALVLHSDISAIKRFKDWFYAIDCWGFRSESLQNAFLKLYGNNFKTFICYSGIPENMLKDSPRRIFPQKIKKYIFAGQLIKRKYPAEIISSIAKIYSQTDNLLITYIGVGEELKKIINYSRKYGLEKNVLILNRVPRLEVRKHMLQSDCFIMISKNEAFGLVYLEAMSAGCLVIASKNEGVDGIIKHGINGFLCEAGNVDELANLIEHINNLPIEVKQNISHAAIKTACDYTDMKVAERYLDTVINIVS